jgi:hypothetical protein
VLPSVDDADAWRLDENTALVAEHLLEDMDLGVPRADIEDDIIRALIDSPKIEFEWSATIATDCELLGTYSAIPPRIRVSRRLRTGRANFTAAHEVGHHLQAHNAEWALGVLAKLRRDHPFIARDVEERVSNEVAVRLLMPDALVASEWGGVLTPQFVLALTRYGRVSREAASMRAVKHAASAAAVVVIARPDGLVTSARGSDASRLAPPPRRTIQPDLAALTESEPGRRGAAEGFIYSTGVSRADLNYDWCWDHDGTHLIVVADVNYQFGDAQWGGDEVECVGLSCGSSYSRSLAAICATCKNPVCPDCAACVCDKREGKLCSNCFTIMSIAESARGDAHDVCPF